MTPKKKRERERKRGGEKERETEIVIWTQFIRETINKLFYRNIIFQFYDLKL